MPDLNKESIYVRRDYAQPQDVNTELILTNSVTVQAPTTDSNAATKKYVDDLKTSSLAEVIAQSPTTIEKITKERYRIDGYNGRNAAGTVINSLNSYPGVGRILFRDTQGRPLAPCGWSYGEGYNAVTGYGAFASQILGVKQIYLTLQETDDFEYVTIASTRKCEYPLSTDDLAYFQNLGRPVICINAEDQYNYHFTSSNNWYDWSGIWHAFKTFTQNFMYNSTNNPQGILWAYSGVANGNLSFWVEEDQLNSLENFKNNVIGFTLGITTASSGGANTNPSHYYGCSQYQVTRFKNEKYVDMNVIIDGFTTSNRQAYVNITLDETLNDSTWNANTLASTNCSLLLKENIFKKIVYNNTGKQYEVIEYHP